ncbi:MAG: alpha/beta hydrolase [Bacteroidota bacterium]
MQDNQYNMRFFPRTFTLLVLLVFLSGAAGFGQKLYQKSFGQAGDPAIVFLHGGPGYNSASFEVAAAAALAEKGYHVIVYDRRKTARSPVKKAKFTFREAEKDLKKVMKRAKVKKASLIGHSFGGALAIRFAGDHPKKVANILLVGAPLDYPATFVTIRNACRKHYTTEGDTTNLRYMTLLDTMDNARLDYAVYCFAHAMSCGLYQPSVLSPEAKRIYGDMASDPQARITMDSRQKPVKGFYNAHQYTTLNFTEDLKAILPSVPVFGIYGAEDGLFDDAAREDLSVLLGKKDFRVVDAASHSVFIDQRAYFIELLNGFFRP